MLEKLSRARFFTGLKYPALFSLLRSTGKRAGISNPVKIVFLKVVIISLLL